MIERPDNRSYRLRGDRQTLAQQSAYKRSWMVYGIELAGTITPAALFPGLSSFIMEIGTGMGEGTALIATQFPDTGFIGVEVHKPGVGALLGYIERFELKNLRLMVEDAHVILRDHFADQSFDGIHLFFPDPWPKRHHLKRRIVQAEFLTLIASKLKSGGYIHIATDWLPYAEWIESIFAKSTLFQGGKIERPTWRPVTKFEGQGIRKGHTVTDLKYYKEN